jgi:hypothetical protein
VIQSMAVRKEAAMPWSASDAPRFNSSTKASPHLRTIWANAANAALKQYGDEGKAIRVANAAVRKSGQKKT